jgi:PP-loop superfamily ATP-utilizing enzyme
VLAKIVLQVNLNLYARRIILLERGRFVQSGGETPRLLEHRQRIVNGLKALGYAYVTLDLGGLRRGSLNEAILGNDIRNVDASPG